MLANQFGVPSSKVIPVSANEKYNLTKLVDEIVFALPNEKKPTLLHAVGEDFQSPTAGEAAKNGLFEVIGDVVRGFVDGIDSVVSKVAGFFSDIKDLFSMFR